MPKQPLRVRRRREVLISDDRRVILRYLNFGRPRRIRSILRRLLRFPRRRVAGALREVTGSFSRRHRDVEEAFADNYAEAARHLHPAPQVAPAHRLLIGAYFTMEYSIEAAALFNPSIVPHPDQSRLPDGAVRFLLSLRATGEGHISSIVFRRGVMNGRGRIRFDPPPRFAYSARPVHEQHMSRELFLNKLGGAAVQHDTVLEVLRELPDPFGPADLQAALAVLRHSEAPSSAVRRATNTIRWLSRANYELHFPGDCLPAETVIFPATEYEARGMEDLRLVRFTGPDGEVRYYGTYTAYDGTNIHPMLIETADFRDFRVRTLTGRYARNKGMALFPRQVDGHYLMLARHDGENLYLLRSTDVCHWNVSQPLQRPREDWELVQLGNCGSPLETGAGWLVLTHGVGPVRRYCIGGTLLDRDRPGRVLGRLRQPLLVPTPAEREGYVPNVVYSCGSMIHRGRVVIPYAMSDSRTAFATVGVEALVKRLLAEGP